MPLPQPGDGIEVMRIVKGVRGSVAMSLQAIFRFDYGTIVPWVTRRDDGINAIGGSDAAFLLIPQVGFLPPAIRVSPAPSLPSNANW